MFVSQLAWHAQWPARDSASNEVEVKDGPPGVEVSAFSMCALAPVHTLSHPETPTYVRKDKK